MIDIFGYDKTIKTEGEIVTSEFASISVGGRMSLVQSVTCQYARQIQSMFEAGASVVYYTQGGSEGNITINAAVGKKGFFKQFEGAKANCGILDKVSVDLREGNKCVTGASGGVSFAGAMVEAFNFAFQSGPVAVTEGTTIRVGVMNRR